MNVAAKMNRPSRYDEDVVKAVAAKLAPKVVEWCGDGSTLDEVVEDIATAVKYHDDGYEIARSLDGIYQPDAALVEILDCASFYRHAELERACEKWLPESGLTPPEIGSRVLWKAGRTGSAVGIVSENHKDGRSTVRFESLGHVQRGPGTHGYIIEWENLEPCSN